MADIETMSVDEIADYLMARTPRTLIIWERSSNRPEWKGAISFKFKGDMLGSVGMAKYVETKLLKELTKDEREIAGPQPD